MASRSTSALTTVAESNSSVEVDAEYPFFYDGEKIRTNRDG
jgi:hypothetical protein